MLPALRPALLLVDDDPTLLSALPRRLTREGFDVRTASSGQAALAALERSWPALVVVDVMMPGMDGFELCRRIKRIADLPIIVLSAVDAGEAKVMALQEYAEDYIVKPFDPDELVARVQRILRRSSTGRGQINLDGGELEIDLVHRRVTNRTGSQALTPTEVRVLQVLIGALGRATAPDPGGHPAARAAVVAVALARIGPRDLRASHRRLVGHREHCLGTGARRGCQRDGRARAARSRRRRHRSGIRRSGRPPG